MPPPRSPQGRGSSRGDNAVQTPIAQPRPPALRTIAANVTVRCQGLQVLQHAVTRPKTSSWFCVPTLQDTSSFIAALLNKTISRIQVVQDMQLDPAEVDILLVKAGVGGAKVNIGRSLSIVGVLQGTAIPVLDFNGVTNLIV